MNPAPSRVGWRDRLSATDQRSVQDLIATAEAADGVAPVGDQVLRELAHDRTRHLLATEGDGVAAYLNLAPADDDNPAMAELVVHPDVRRRGKQNSSRAAAAVAPGP